jgi:hypothetical protein
MNDAFGVTYKQLQPKLFLSAGPSATKRGPNIFHPEWLANPVLVKKKGGKWRMCVDYTGLNKACPKVPYPLPRIDQIVDSTTRCETLSFLDAYSGYHQIKMK